MDILFVFLLILGMYALQRSFWTKRMDITTGTFLDVLFVVHLALFAVYIIYAYLTDSDSFNYYRTAYEAEDWIGLWGTQTEFMNFITWPFANLLGLSYNSVMLIFSYLGFQGIVLSYLVAKENTPRLRPITGSFSILEYLFLLPNLHFWSSSIGKGSMMLLAVGLLLFGLSRFTYRKFYILLGVGIIFLVRPHILYAFLLGTVVAILFSSKGLKTSIKVGFFLIALLFLFFISDDVTELTGGSGLNVFDSNMLVHRNAELSKSNSGVNTGGGQIVKLFTFWFRPLFVDSPGVLGIIVSFENTFMLYLFLMLLRNGLKKWRMLNTYYRILIFSFLFASIALAQVGGNLGIIMRQKSQIMPLFFIVFSFAESLRQNRIA
jgi:hypothetical protein